jgi:hypothetical protein
LQLHRVLSPEALETGLRLEQSGADLSNAFGARECAARG